MDNHHKRKISQSLEAVWLAKAPKTSNSMSVSMDSLSLEILELIIPHLFEVPPIPNRQPWDPQPCLRVFPYATISRKWQYAVERFTFSNIKKFSTDLAMFKQVFGSSQRRRLLRQLHYEINLPTYSENRIFRFERKNESRENQQVFETEIRAIYDELATWETTQGISLTFEVSSPMDPGRRPSDLPAGFRQRWAFEDITLTLEGETDLPQLTSVKSLEIPIGGRHWHPSAIGRIISSLPNLERLNLGLSAPKPKRVALQEEHRLALAKALESPSLRNLTSLTIYIEQTIPHNHSFGSLPSRDPQYTDGDALNLAVRKLAQTSPLSDLSLSGPWLVSPALFGGEDPFPRLERVKIQGALITYDGRWYYTGDPNAVSVQPEELRVDDDDDDDDETSDSDESFNSEYHEFWNEGREALLNGEVPTYMWRTKPDSELFDPLAKTMAAAVHQMPNLRNLLLSMGLNYMDDYGIIFECLQPGENAEWFQSSQSAEELGVTRWNVTLMPEARWEVPDDVARIWKEYVGESGVVAVAPF